MLVISNFIKSEVYTVKFLSVPLEILGQLIPGTFTRDLHEVVSQ